MNNFKEVNIAEFQTKPFEIFGKDFMALCAGSEQNGCNAMTIAWGHLGSLWERGSHANRLPTRYVLRAPEPLHKEIYGQRAVFRIVYVQFRR